MSAYGGRANTKTGRLVARLVTLSDREKTLIVISNAVSVYSIYAKNPETMPKNLNLIDFVLKSMPAELKKDLTADLIDEVFEFVAKTQSQLS